MISAVIFSGWVALIGLTGSAEAIIGSGHATDGQFPYVVRIKDTEQHSLCGGAIISETHVLTAAHCVDNINKESSFIVAGVINIQNVSDENMYKIAKITVHPAYEPTKWIPSPDSPDEYMVDEEPQNDIAMIQVERSFRFTENLGMIWIALTFPSSYHYCSFAGWGVTDERMYTSNELMFTDLAIGEPDYCAAINCAHDIRKFCVYNRRKKSAICSGDSGGPLVCAGLLVGIASTSTCDPEEAAGFVNVIEYLPFITSVQTASATNRRQCSYHSNSFLSRLTRSSHSRKQ